MVGRREGRQTLNSAKQDIFDTIRSCFPPSTVPREAAYAAIPRTYTQTGSLDAEARVQLLEDRLRDYGTGVYLSSEEELPQSIAKILAERGKRSLFATASIPRQWLPDSVRFRADNGASYDELDTSEGALTDCAVAIAETGTIILRHTPEEGRRALTLVPDYHLCIVQVEKIVHSVVEGMRKTAEFAQVPVTTISGPSATADIEMTRIKGVHGPRFMDVIIVF
jgi:L-lactate dehydrogenase complex protein LldG